MNASEVKGVLVIALLYIFRMLGLFMVLPVLPLLGYELEDATTSLIGLALGAYGLSQALLQIPLGYLSDRYGRKLIIVVGFVIFVIGSITAAMSTSIHGVILGRLLQGSGAVASTLMALTSDITRVEYRSYAMAAIGISIGASFTLALIVGPAISAVYGLSGVFWVTALLGCIGIAIIVLLLPSPRVHTVNRETELALDMLKQVLRDASLRKINVCIFMVHFHLMASFAAFPLVISRSQLVDDDSHGLFYLVILLLSLIPMRPLIKLADNSMRSVSVILLTIGFFVASYFLLASGLYRQQFTVVAFILFFLTINLLEIILPSLLSKIAAAGARGTAMGIYSSSQFLGAFAGGIVGGLLLELYDISGMFYLLAMLAGGWFLYARTIKAPANFSSRTFELADFPGVTANQLTEALSSLSGVEEVVVVESEQCVYIKVDNDKFNDEDLERMNEAENLRSK